MKDNDGKHVLSNAFPVRRGVVQGDITSPIYFIMVLEAILRRYDNSPHKGVEFGGVNLHTLGYADDAALVDSNAEIASERVSSIAQGSKSEADMEINIEKTECMYVKRQQRVETPDEAAAAKVCKYKCKNPGCGWIFGNRLGLRIHQGKWCQWQQYYRVERILDHTCKNLPVGIDKCEFLIKWHGYSDAHNSWVPYEDVTKAAITEYLRSNGIYDYSWRFRCQHCDKPCKSKRGAKIHYARKCRKREREQEFTGTVAQRLHRDVVLQERQKQEAVIKCGEGNLKNCYNSDI